MNTLYIVALGRFEAGLISGISIPIPALTYTQVKRDLQELIEKNNGRKAGQSDGECLPRGHRGNQGGCFWRYGGYKD